MKLKLFWRRSKTNWRRKLRPEGENIEIIQWNITTKVLSRRFTYQSLFTFGHSYVSKFLPFCAAGDFLWSFVRFYLSVTVLKYLKKFLHIIVRKNGEPTIRKNLTLHQPVLKCSKPNQRPIFNKRFWELRLAYGKVIWFNKAKILMKTQ